MDGVSSKLTPQHNTAPTQKPPRWFTAIATMVGLSLVLAILIWSASRRTAADPSVDFVLRNVKFLESTPQSTFRVATFNIHSGKGTDGIRDLTRIATTIPHKLDLIWLNEVRSGFFGLREEQTQFIAEKTNRAFIFFPTEKQYFHGHFGNAILTRKKLTSIQYLPLPCSQQKRFRNAVLTSTLINGETVNILATHLDENIDRLPQLQQIRSLFESLRAPAILMGDLNTRVHEPDMQGFFKTDSQQISPKVVNALKGKTGHRKDGHGVDWILVKGLDVIDAGLIDSDASDHPLLWAELQLPKRIQIAQQNR